MVQHGEVATFCKAPLLASEWPVSPRKSEGRGWLSKSGPLIPKGSTQDVDKQELLECICPLIEVDKDWVPDSHGSCLYVRPVLMGNEVGIAVGAASVGPFISASASEEYKG